MDLRFRSYLAELLGTFALVFLGAGTVCATFLKSPPPLLASLPLLDVTGIALAEGFTLAVLLTVLFPLAPGCLNPAITLTLWVCKRLDLRQALALILAQLLGATLAASERARVNCASAASGLTGSAASTGASAAAFALKLSAWIDAMPRTVSFSPDAMAAVSRSLIIGADTAAGSSTPSPARPCRASITAPPRSS